MFSGEELTICYVEKGRPKEERIKDLQESFFFQCSCSLCSPLSPCSLSSRSLGSVSCSSSSFPKYGEDVLELSEKMMKAIVCPQCSGLILSLFFFLNLLFSFSFLFLFHFFLSLFFFSFLFSFMGEFNKVLKRIWDCHQQREREREERRKGGRNRRRGRRRREMGM